MHRILIIDDDRTVCKSLELLLKRRGYGVRSIHRPEETSAALGEFKPDLALLDMNFTIETSGRGGMKLLGELLEERPDLPVIQMTGWATVQLAVEGMKAGARDFIAKPWDNKELLNTIATELEKNAAAAAGAGVSDGPFDTIIGRSDQLLSVLNQAKRVAPTQASVLITGESGTGKELVAEAIHAASPRRPRPFIAVNLGGIPAALFESELFGHRAGAFTGANTDRKGRFEIAEGGTLFLDEIGDLPAAAQVKLLRVLQQRQYERLGESTPRRTDIRLISATSRQLPSLVAADTFREDLLYRLNLIHLHLPALRERPDDIPLLAEHFLASARRRYQRPQLTLTPAATKWLRLQDYPGNIRQLQNLIERAAILSPDPTIRPEDLTELLGVPTASPIATTIGRKTLEEVEIEMIRASLARHGGEVTAAARELGLTRASLYRRMEKFKL